MEKWVKFERNNHKCILQSKENVAHFLLILLMLFQWSALELSALFPQLANKINLEML